MVHVPAFHPKKMISTLALYLTLAVILMEGATYASKERCSTCKNIVENFNEVNKLYHTFFSQHNVNAPN